MEKLVVDIGRATKNNNRKYLPLDELSLQYTPIVVLVGYVTERFVDYTESFFFSNSSTQSVRNADIVFLKYPASIDYS